MKKMIKAAETHINIWDESYKPAVTEFDADDLYDFVDDHLMPALDEIIQSDRMIDRLIEVYNMPSTKDHQSYRANLMKVILGE